MSQAQPPKENTLLFWMAAPKLDFNRTNRSSNHYKKVTSHFWTRDLTYHPKAFEILQANTLGHLILQSTNQANTLGELTHRSSRTNTITLPNPDTNWQSSPLTDVEKKFVRDEDERIKYPHALTADTRLLVPPGMVSFGDATLVGIRNTIKSLSTGFCPSNWSQETSKW